MFKRIQKVVVGVGALAALAAGGAVFAQAQSPSAPAQTPGAAEQTKGPDRDTVQSGDQTTPDRPAAATVARKVRHAPVHHVRVLHKTAKAHKASVDNGTAQSGDQNTPDQPGVSESSGESPSGAENAPESATNNDGPGGHADEPGTANLDHQAQGVE